ncbi:MAG: hypothetical protein HKO98_14170, partial [Gemmatimonadetes bacterium]|nr:hypothetical protein [Gemmatimonadota bacterium]
WADVVALIAVVDSALTVVLEAFSEGRYAPAGARAGKMIAEEAFHGDMARAWVRSLAGGTSESRARIADACNSRLPRTLAWMAPDDDAAARLAEAGIMPTTDELLERFADRHANMFAAAGVQVPAPNREGWDAARGRGPGHPGLEAVERARGDLNRELFVE